MYLRRLLSVHTLDYQRALDPVVDQVERNNRLVCFVDRLHRLVDDFTTRLDLADYRSTWSTCGHVDHSFFLVLAIITAWPLTQKNSVSKHLICFPSSKWKA